MEPSVERLTRLSLGRDFRRVRVHADARAARSAQELGAEAYSYGEHVVFAPGHYPPATGRGWSLLVHELAHTLQQPDPVPGDLRLGPAGDDVEREARAYAEGRRAVPSRRPAPSIRRQTVPWGGATPGEGVGLDLIYVIKGPPEDEFTSSVLHYVSTVLRGQRHELVDGIDQIVASLAAIARQGQKVRRIRIVGHGHVTSGAVALVPPGGTKRAWFTPREIAAYARRPDVRATMSAVMAPGAVVEFWGCNIGGHRQAGPDPAAGTAWATLFGSRFRATAGTFLTRRYMFRLPALPGEEGKTAQQLVADEGADPVELKDDKGRWLTGRAVLAKTSAQVARFGPDIEASFNEFLLGAYLEMVRNGDLAPVGANDPALAILVMRRLFDRAGGDLRRIAVSSGGRVTSPGERQRWAAVWKTFEPVPLEDVTTGRVKEKPSPVQPAPTLRPAPPGPAPRPAPPTLPAAPPPAPPAPAPRPAPPPPPSVPAPAPRPAPPRLAPAPPRPAPAPPQPSPAVPAPPAAPAPPTPAQPSPTLPRVPSPAPPARPVPEAGGAGPGRRERDGCVGVSGEAFGEAFRFERGTDRFAAGEQERLRLFAGTIASGDVLAVHGFASEEGPRDLNERLSCMRAHAGLTVLTRNGVSPAQIRRPLFMHGAMPGPRLQRRSVVVGRETRPRVPSMERVPVTPPVAPQAAPAPEADLPEVGVKRDFEMTPERPLFNLGPFLTTWQAKLWLEASLRCGDPSTKIAFSLSSEAKADFEAKLGGALQSFKVKGSLVPGRLSKIGLEWGDRGALFGHEVTVEVAVVASPAPFQTTVKTAFPYDSYEHWPHVQFHGCRIRGKAMIGAEIKFYPNPAWWAAAGAGTARAIRAGTTAARGLFVAEAGGLTTVGAAAVAGAVATAYIAWIGYGFYQLTRAHRAGRQQAIGYAFAGGYASALTELVDLDVVSAGMRAQLPGLLDLDWQATFNEAAALYVNEQAYTIPSIERAGRAAIVQEVDRYIREHGVDAWKALSARLRQRYGPSPLLRRARFFQVMQGQVLRNAPIGIELR